jgi:hypothetical protein
VVTGPSSETVEKKARRRHLRAWLTSTPRKPSTSGWYWLMPTLSVFQNHEMSLCRMVEHDRHIWPGEVINRPQLVELRTLVESTWVGRSGKPRQFDGDVDSPACRHYLVAAV